jgi:hypothetical protein
MPAVWSFNTTVRNPERMQNFLRTLKVFEGQVFDEEHQENFFALQIKKRLYKPMPKTLGALDLINEVKRKTADEIPDNIIERIIAIYRKKSVNGETRGRTTAGILNRFGLCVASKSKGSVIITELGNKWLNNEIDDQKLFFRFLLKWQYPNPIEDGYTNFNIKPFIATLHFIKYINDKWQNLGNESVGISKDEFRLFIPSLINYTEIESQANELIKFRTRCRSLSGKSKINFIKQYEKKCIKNIFGNTDDILTKFNDLKDYTDSAIRYFRMTNFIYLRGNDTHVDIAPDYKIEVEKLINNDDASARSFTNTQEYLDYLINTSLPALPWDNEVDLSRIKIEMIEVCRNLANTINKISEFEIFLKTIHTLNLTKQIEKLKNFKNWLQIEKLRSIRYDKEKLKELIVHIPNTFSDRAQTVTTRPSLDLEWFVSLSLMVLNDAKAVIPSFKLGDDGLPTGFASNISDIECLYESFGMTVEVTLLMGRDQWFAEGQPVMRHLRDFENKYNSYGEKTYCLFIAPFLHRDTLNTFWGTIKGIGYEGHKQKIIPLRIDQYVKILNIVGNSLNQNVIPVHTNYGELLKKLYESCSVSEDVYKWIDTFDSIIDNWGKTLS